MKDEQTAFASRGTVLIVDDEPQVLRTASMALELAGYRTLAASTATEAEDLCRTHPELQAVVMDVVLRDIHGFDVVPRLRQIHEGLPVLYISGYPGQLLFESRGIHEPFLFKPFTPQELVEALDAVCQPPHARAA